MLFIEMRGGVFHGMVQLEGFLVRNTINNECQPGNEWFCMFSIFLEPAEGQSFLFVELSYVRRDTGKEGLLFLVNIVPRVP
jgi:hypothetical protein